MSSSLCASTNFCALRIDKPCFTPAQLNCSSISQNCHYSASSKLRSFSVSAFRKQRSKGLPPGAYEMVDEEGDTVIVVGVEDDHRPPPSDDQLRWKPSNDAKPGDISELAWYRLLKSEPIRTGRVVDGSKDDTSSSEEVNSKETPQRSYPEVTKKGLFSRLKVQPLKKLTKSRSDKLDSGLKHPYQQMVSKSKKYKEAELEDINMVSTKRYGGEGSKQAPRSQTERRRSEDLLHEWLGGEENIVSNIEEHQGKILKKRNKTTVQEQNSREMVAEDFFSIRSFTDVGANDVLIRSLNLMGVTQPSQIQAITYQHILEGCSCILADQTGSGKTLAYLAPLYQRLLIEEKEGISKSLPKRPRGLVILPTSELAAQVLNVCRLLSKGGAALKSMVATGGFRLKTQIEALENSCDIVIATPGRFLQLCNLESLQLDNLKSIVLDEVDVLFDDPEFSETLEKMENSTPLKAQYIHVTATLPVDVCDSILEKHPTSIPLMGPGLHCTATGLQEVLVDCSGEGEKNPETAYENKKNALLQIVEQQPVPKTIIFCNKIETCRKVENALKRFDRKGDRLIVLPYHAALSLEARLENMHQFSTTVSNKSMLLVCTDRASRGLDVVDVEHVILFDFPRDPSEYVRRVGRTARAGGVGKAFAFVVGKQVSLARKIMVRNEKGHPIHTVPSHSY